MPAFLENNGNKGRAWNGGCEKCMNDTVTTIILAQALRSTEIPPLHGTVSRVAGDFWFSISIEPKAFTIHIGTYPPFEMTRGLQLSVRKNIEKGL